MDGAQLLIAGIGGLGSSWALKAHERAGNDVDLVLVDADENSFSNDVQAHICLLYTSPSPRDLSTSRMPSSA